MKKLMVLLLLPPELNWIAAASQLFQTCVSIQLIKNKYASVAQIQIIKCQCKSGYHFSSRKVALERIALTKEVFLHNSKKANSNEAWRYFFWVILICCPKEISGILPIIWREYGLLSVVFWKIITALKSHMTCYNLNLNSYLTNLRNL